MAHEIKRNDRGLFVGQPAWHNLLTTVPFEWNDTLNPATAFMEGMTQAGLVYPVAPVEVWGTVLVPQPDGSVEEKIIEFTDFVGVYRTDDFSGLHIHQAGYEIGQNEELARIMDGINAGAHDGKVIVPAAFVSMKGGRVVAVTGKFVEPITLTGGDVIEPYVVARTSHDASYVTGVRSCMFRVVCMNTMRASMSGKANLDWSVKHTLNRAKQVEEGIKLMASAVNDMRNFQAEANAMIEQAVTDAEFAKLVETVLPMPNANPTDLQRGNVETQRNAIKGLWSDDERVGNYKGTAWGAFQAVSTWEQWVQPARDQVEKNTKAELGAGFPISTKAGRLLAPKPVEVVAAA